MMAMSSAWPGGAVAAVDDAQPPLRPTRVESQTMGVVLYSRPPPGISNTLVAIFALGWLLTILLVVRGEQVVLRLLNM